MSATDHLPTPGQGLIGWGGMLDARERVSAQLHFTAELQPPGMLHGRLLRSVWPHARITHIDVSRARDLPGVAAVVTGQDVLARSGVQATFGPILRDQPLLAFDKVRFVGDPLVAVAAEDLDTAQEALDLVDVEYAELPAVFDTDTALAEGAPVLHDEKPRSGPTPGDVILHRDASHHSNVCNYFRLRHGDVEAGFRAADHVFEDQFTSPAIEHVPLETHACVATLDGFSLTVTATTQTPHNLRAQLAEVFGLPLSRVRVVVPRLGGAFGAKCYTKIEPLTAFLALVTRRPVRLVLTREEQAVTLTKHAVTIHMKTGVRRDGTLVARQSTCHFNTGAYADIGPRLIKNGGYGTAGPYHIPHVWVDSFAVYTNLPPAGAFRGYGAPQGAWAYESQMDLIAERLDLDPVELRCRNLLRDGQQFATGETVHDVHFADLLTRAVHAVGWDPMAAPVREGTKVRAFGAACALKGAVTPSTSTATAKLNDDGSLDILTSSVEMGQGLQTAMAIIAARRMGVPLERIHVSEVDTQVTPYDQQTSSSRSTHAMGSAVALALDDIRDQLLDLGANQLEVDRADLEVADGQVRVKGAIDRALGLSEVVRTARRGNLLGSGTFQVEGGLDPDTGQGIATVHWHQAAGAAEVEVDLETGQVRVVRYEGAVYAGQVINPVQAELQTEGSITFGVGQALFEEMVYDAGQLQNGNLGEYMLPSIKDLPAIGVMLVEHDPSHADEMADVHGLGETSLPPVAPAIGNAVYRATGVRIRDLPITPEKVLRGLRDQPPSPSGRGLGVPSPSGRGLGEG
ncbi:MAG: xanthine dehydrogenase family protein [Chloroflexi bacterium]|nr:xanthine dehydrogenase family protein [Chloroflexota bacterium]